MAGIESRLHTILKTGFFIGQTDEFCTDCPKLVKLVQSADSNKRLKIAISTSFWLELSATVRPGNCAMLSF